MAKIRRGKNLKHWKSHRPLADTGKLRIVGGKFRGRQISYSGDPVTRPMKDNVREAVFNLIGGYLENKVAFDLFGGTGAMGLEAISRGASGALIIERHIPTVRVIKENIQALGLEGKAEVVSGDSFFWGRKFIKEKDTWPSEPWIILCCPPYDFYVDRWDELQILISSMFEAAPQQSIFVVESDDRFAPQQLPDADSWEVRQYAPARVAIYKKGQM